MSQRAVGPLLLVLHGSCAARVGAPIAIGMKVREDSDTRGLGQGKGLQAGNGARDCRIEDGDEGGGLARRRNGMRHAGRHQVYGGGTPWGRCITSNAHLAITTRTDPKQILQCLYARFTCADRMPKLINERQKLSKAWLRRETFGPVFFSPLPRSLPEWGQGR